VSTELKLLLAIVNDDERASLRVKQATSAVAFDAEYARLRERYADRLAHEGERHNAELADRSRLREADELIDVARTTMKSLKAEARTALESAHDLLVKALNDTDTQAAVEATERLRRTIEAARQAGAATEPRVALRGQEKAAKPGTPNVAISVNVALAEIAELAETVRGRIPDCAERSRGAVASILADLPELKGQLPTDADRAAAIVGKWKKLLAAANAEADALIARCAARPAGEQDEASDVAKLLLKVSTIPSVKTTTITVHDRTWARVVEKLTDPGEWPTKAACPLLKLVTFRGTRANANAHEVYGLVGDYDAGQVGVAEAAERLEAAGVEAFIYTTPSHSHEKPRWRVVAPLSNIHEAKDHERLMARLNGALGGILASESFTLSQFYYFGRVQGAPYETRRARGQCIDLLEAIEPIGKNARAVAPPAPSALLSPDDASVDDFTAVERAHKLQTVTAEQAADLRLAMMYLAEKGLLNGYTAWIEAGLALASLKGTAFEEVALETWLAASQRTATPDMDEARAKWTTFSPDRITFLSIFSRAQEAGWVNPRKGIAPSADDFGDLGPERAAKEAIDRVSKRQGYDFPLDAGRIDLNARPGPRDHVIDRLFLAGKPYVLGGAGGTLKTQTAVSAGISIATGRDFFGFSVPKPGAAMLVHGEEDREEIRRRVGATAKLMRLTAEERALVERRVLAFATVGEDIRLTALRNGAITPTGLADTIIERAQQLAERAGVRVRLIVFDHMMLVSGGEVNSNEHAAAVIREAARIGARTGAVVVILAHSPKAAGGKDEPDQNDILGGVASVNLARGAMIMRRMTAGEAQTFGVSDGERARYARVTVVKANATPSGLEFWLRADYDPEFEAVALARVDDLQKGKVGPGKRAQVVLAVLHKLQGEARTPVSAKDWQERTNKLEGIGRSQFFAHVRELREAGLVVRDEQERYTTPDMTAEAAERPL